jgi:hypothetical protein
VRPFKGWELRPLQRDGELKLQSAAGTLDARCDSSSAAVVVALAVADMTDTFSGGGAAVCRGMSVTLGIDPSSRVTQSL